MSFGTPNRAKPNDPCRLCGKKKGCFYWDDGTIGCMKVPSAKYLPQCGAWIHKPEADVAKDVQPETDWAAKAAAWAVAMGPGRRQWLEHHLGLPENASLAIDGIGWSTDQRGGHFTFPMRDGFGRIVGVSRRYLDGSKYSLGRNGLFVPRHLPGNVMYVVEGGSDVLAMSYSGLPSLGRPSNATGGQEIGRMLQRFEGTVCVIVECDENAATGDWPGYQGSATVAAQIRASVNPVGRTRDVRVVTRRVPDRVKDSREWLVANAYDGAEFERRLNLNANNEV